MWIDGRWMNDSDHCDTQESVMNRAGQVIGYILNLGQGTWSATDVAGRHQTWVKGRSAAISAVEQWQRGKVPGAALVTTQNVDAGAFVGALVGTLLTGLVNQGEAQPADRQHLELLQRQNDLLQQQNAALLQALGQLKPQAPPTGPQLPTRTRR